MNKVQTQRRPSWIVRSFRAVVVFFSSLIVLIFAVAMVVGALSRKDDPRPEPPAPRSTPAKSAPQPGRPLITKVESEAVRASMSQYPGVRDTEISAEGSTFNLTVQVSPGVTPAQARELADSIVRQVKGIINDNSPTKVIGTGMYTYRVSVTADGDAVMAQGEKAAGAESIRWTGGAEPTPPPDLGNAPDAWTMIQKYVTDGLKSPKSASFPSDGWQRVYRKEDGVWAVDSYVDARNAFNAEIRTRFYCEVRRVSEVNNGWSLVTLRFIDR
ncbi:MAG: hypothetical protein GC200_05125 [Tepidisphaera sp.]|nr:hypothetical protein [Tepidisphaera sp.]